MAIKDTAAKYKKKTSKSFKESLKMKTAPKPAFAFSGDVSPERWQISSSLFADLDEKFLKALDLLPKAIEKVWAIPASKYKFLPHDIADLSQLLTRGRSDLRLPYWHKAANLSAYLYYFLTWNIIRLGRLFSSLTIPAPLLLEGQRPVLLDMGSGPLALPIALWLAKKDWRDSGLQVLALDSSKQPMEVGRELFYTLADMMGEKAWPVSLYNGPAERPFAALQHLRARNEEQQYYPWLLAEANILNELITKNPDRDSKYDKEDLEEGEDFNEQDSDCESSLLGRLLSSWLPIWQNSPGKALALFIEPGTRLGGDAIMNLRRCAIRLGFEPLAPCTQSGQCPLLSRTRQKGSQAESWCHFTFSALAAPKWLKDLSRESGLEKNSLSLSILLLGEKNSKPNNKYSARVISQPFRVPGLKGECRYACGSLGLELLENAAYPPSGSLTLAQQKTPPEKDKKSGAVVCIPKQNFVKKK